MEHGRGRRSLRASLQLCNAGLNSGGRGSVTYGGWWVESNPPARTEASPERSASRPVHVLCSVVRRIHFAWDGAARTRGERVRWAPSARDVMLNAKATTIESAEAQAGDRSPGNVGRSRVRPSSSSSEALCASLRLLRTPLPTPARATGCGVTSHGATASRRQAPAVVAEEACMCVGEEEADQRRPRGV